MHHTFIDNYSSGTSVLHRADPRLKIAVAVVVIVCIVTVPPSDATLLIAYAVALSLLWLYIRLPFMHLAKRLSIALPLVAIIAAGTLFAGTDHAPWQLLCVLLAKAALAIAVTSLIVSTTAFPKLIRGLEWYGMPCIVTAVLAFLYRYFFVLIDEFERLSIGRRSRQFTGKRMLTWKSGAWMIGTLFVRSMERSERIYRAMLSRGFDGRMHALDERSSLSAGQVSIGVIAAAAAIAVRAAPAIMRVSEGIPL